MNSLRSIGSAPLCSYTLASEGEITDIEITQSLTLVDEYVVGVSYLNTLEQSLTLVSDYVVEAYYNFELEQSLTLVDDYIVGFVYSETVEQSLTLDDEFDFDVIFIANLVDTLTLIDNVSPTYSYLISVEQGVDWFDEFYDTQTTTLEIEQSLSSTELYSVVLDNPIEDSLTLVDELDVDLIDGAFVDHLNLTQTINVFNNYDITLIQSLTLVDDIEVGYTYLFEICDNLSFKDTFSNAYDFEITQTLTLVDELPDIEFIYDTLNIEQVLDTNFTEFCGSVSDSPPDKSFIQSLSINQSVVVNTIYTVPMVQSLSLNNTIAWRP